MSPPIDERLLRTLLSRLSLRAFDRMLLKLFNEGAPAPFDPLRDAGDHVFFQPLLDSYGDSLHSVFVAHHSPIELATEFSPALVGDPDLVNRIARVWRLYKGQKGSWGMVSPSLRTDRKLQSFAVLTNLSGFSRDFYEREIIPAYARVARRLRLRPGRFFVGSYDSFLDLSFEKTRKAFAEFVAQDSDEISIALSDDGPAVRRVASERLFSSGVLPQVRCPLEPLFVLRRDEAALETFEHLLRRGASEAELEKFLTAHYKLIFGPQYDSIQTQLWLRFPHLDIGKRARRLDVFLRNSVRGDWELHELKGANQRLTGTVRDVPRLASAVAAALQQVRSYGRLLAQDNVKQRLRGAGIEYFEPTLNLVVGRAPEVPQAQWRWLVSNWPDVRIATYEELLKEARLRHAERARLLDSVGWRTT